MEINHLKKVDLHMHSNVSDGLLSPNELVKMASSKGLCAIGLTDHDSISGLKDAEDSAPAYGIEIVPGVEISVLEEHQEIHILGYYPNYREHLHERLAEIRTERYKRMEQIIEKLKRLGFKIEPEEVEMETGDAAPGRMHLARILLKKKYVHTLDEAFSLYLSKNREAYVPRKTISLGEAMTLLRDVESVRVLAHPGFNDHSTVSKLLPLGLQGLEVFHPDHSRSQVKYFMRLAEKLNLIITGGSDYHGDNRSNVDYHPGMAISRKYLDTLKITRFPY